MLPDAHTPGARFVNVTALAEGGQIHFTGFYEAAGLIPAILFSVGVPWAASQCLRNVCCLWDMALAFRDAELFKALQSPHCDEHVNVSALELMKGNAADVGRWDVRTQIQPSFIAMLFICLRPFYIWYEVVPIQWNPISVQWSSTWYGQRCHNVLYEGRTVCVHCANAKPSNAEYIFTVNWFRTFHCDWVCHPGYVGPNCEVGVNAAVGISIAAVGALCVGVLFFCFSRRKRASGFKDVSQMFAREVETAEPQRLQLTAPVVRSRTDSNVITFRENTPVSEIRIKLN